MIANQSDYKQAQESCIQRKSRNPHWSLIGWFEDPTSGLRLIPPKILLLHPHCCRDAGCRCPGARQWSNAKARQTEGSRAEGIQHFLRPRHRNMTSPVKDPHRRIENRNPPQDQHRDPESSLENHILLLADRRKRSLGGATPVAVYFPAPRPRLAFPMIESSAFPSCASISTSL